MIDPEANSPDAPRLPAYPASAAAQAQPSRFFKETINVVATVLICATYFEDGWRLFAQWDDQLGFVARHAGLPSSVAATILILSALMQLSSAALLVPSSFLKEVKLFACGLVGLNVFLQPILYNQMSNTDLLTLSAAQLGTLGLIFTNTHADLYPNAWKDQGGAFDAFLQSATAAKSDSKVSPSWAAIVQVASRLLLTVDLVVVYTTHLIFEATPLSVTCALPRTRTPRERLANASPAQTSLMPLLHTTHATCNGRSHICFFALTRPPPALHAPQDQRAHPHRRRPHLAGLRHAIRRVHRLCCRLLRRLRALPVLGRAGAPARL